MTESGDGQEVGRIRFRVRYCECDPMGVAHHGAFAAWFEMGRTELYRAAGNSYRGFESRGLHLAVVELHVRYKRPIHYDDVLELETCRAKTTRAKLVHKYTLLRDGIICATASTALACVVSEGRLQPMPRVFLPLATE